MDWDISTRPPRSESPENLSWMPALTQGVHTEEDQYIVWTMRPSGRYLIMQGVMYKCLGSIHIKEKQGQPHRGPCEQLQGSIREIDRYTSLLTAAYSSTACILQAQMMPQTPTSRPRPATSANFKLPDLAQIREVCCAVKPLSFMIVCSAARC